jgi:CRISPR-associated protein Csx17
MPILTLHGCSPEPLGNYLKALGVFRLVAEQADPAARAWWEAGVLRLTTRFDETALQGFFLGQSPSEPAFAPSPIFAPWGGRPGFYEEGSNAGAKERLERLVSSENDRKQLGPAISVLRKLRDLLSTHQTWNGKAKKAEFPWRSAEKGKKDKNLLMATCRNTMPGAFIDWMDACLTLEDDASFGILFGTGGNEGSADITNNFWLFIEHCIGFPRAHEASGQWLASSLFSAPRLSGLKETSGQLFPSSAKGENIGQGFTGATATNPWDVVLAMEGSMLFAGAMTKRLSQHGRGKAAFPFMLDHIGTGQPSESGRDEPQQDARKSKCKGEIFIPLWDKPITLSELKSLLAEGRLQTPAGNPAAYSVQAFEAIAGLGVSTGIRAFRRVGFFERRGNVNIAATLEVLPIPRRKPGLLPLVDELKLFRVSAFRNLREGPAIPVRLLSAKQRLESSIAQALRDACHGTETKSSHLQRILKSAAALLRECSVTKSARSSVAPSSLLSKRWVSSEGITCLDKSPECGLACAVASLLPWGESKTSRESSVGPLLTNLVPVVRQGKRWEWAERSRAPVWSEGASLLTNLSAVLRRRLVDSQSGKGEGLPLVSFHPASLGDLWRLWNGELDESRLAELIRALGLVDFGTEPEQSKLDAWQAANDTTPTLAQSGVWFDANDTARLGLRENTSFSAHEKQEREAAFALPRAYALLKLCFVGGRLPRLPSEKGTTNPTGREPFPNSPLRQLNLLLAGRGAEAVQTAARMLRAKGYPPIVPDGVLTSGEWSLSTKDSQRMAGLLLIPVRRSGVLAALSIKPQQH